MKPLEHLSPRVQLRIDTAGELLGRYPAICYAQRVVGQPETGGLTHVQATLINSMNEENFLGCFQNLCVAHVNASTNTPEKKKELIAQIKLGDKSNAVHVPK